MGLKIKHVPVGPMGVTPDAVAAMVDALEDFDKPMLGYCRSGNRSAGAYDTMTKEGLTNILHMNQGITAWQQSGLPLQK